MHNDPVIAHITWEFPNTLITLGVIVATALVAHLLLRRAISTLTRRMAQRARAEAERQPDSVAMQRVEKRTATIGSMLRNLVAIVVWVVAVMTAMSTIGIPLGPLLASAGIGGIALAFGAQSLVKDVLSGLVMLIEDQYGVGDYVDTGDIAGTVEEVTLRITKVRDVAGTLWFIPNGQIVSLGNSSLGWSNFNVDIPIAAGQDVPAAVEVLTTVTAEFGKDPQWEGVLMEPPASLGVQAVSPGAVTLRMSMKTKANQQWAPSRALREQAVNSLTTQGFELPILPPADAGA